MKLSETFHLGLCMAGSITAGAYTAGVIDYLIEALEEWEKVKGEDDVPSHQVVIDLLCGSSGGGITAALSLFALTDKMDHAQLHEDGITYKAPENNILWKTWVEMSQEDMLESLLSSEDINPQKISSLLNASFIDQVAIAFKNYITALPKNQAPPAFFGPAPEMFMTLFNITGINYELHTKSSSNNYRGIQFVSDHRDLAHFRWTDTPYPPYIKHPDTLTEKKINVACDGRIPVSVSNTEYIPVMIDAAKATGAFPVGLKARLVERPAKFVWDNPFFNKGGSFNEQTIFLGKQVTSRESIYTSLNSDGGTANNEPVELARNILLNMREKIYKDVAIEDNDPGDITASEKAVAVKEKLVNTSIILIDPFPSVTNDIQIPQVSSGNFPLYAKKLIKAMNSQLIFDAKDALDAYKKENYGLHIVSPSRENVPPEYAIASGSLGGFGGFIDREFRVHDFFLGRKNCQGFLRKYFVARADEPDPESRACIQSVLKAYEGKPRAKERFAFTDDAGILWLPIIPDVALAQPIKLIMKDALTGYEETSKLPLYKLKKLPLGFLNKYKASIAHRFMEIVNNLLTGNWMQRVAVRTYTWFRRKKVSAWVSEKIFEDLLKRDLVENNSGHTKKAL